MRREQLEHVLRAAGDVVSEREFIVGGSQAILASYDEAELPPAATMSVEVDLVPIDDRDARKADLIDGALGEGSRFHAAHHIYADGIEESTLVLPKGWRDRLIRFETTSTNGVVGRCLEPHDLAIGKLVAGRPKDFMFCDALINAGLLGVDELRQRLRHTNATAQVKSRIAEWLDSRAGDD